MIRLVSVASITLPIFLLVSGSSISLAEGQTVGKQLMDALHAGEGVVRQIEEGGITVINDIERLFGVRDVENHVDKAREALAQGNSEAASAAITLSQQLMRPSKIAAHTFLV